MTNSVGIMSYNNPHIGIC